MNKSILNLTVLALVSVAFATQALADNVATQDVSYEVSAINEIETSGSPSLVISTVTAGGDPVDATAHGLYAVTTNEMNRKITASINSNMPALVTLSVSLDAPDGASPASPVSLSTTPQDVVTGVSTVSESGLDITYTLSATAEAGVVAAGSKTVTYTLTEGA